MTVKKYFISICFFSFFAAWIPFGICNESQSPEIALAQEVVNSYMTALEQGNTNMIKRLLGGKLLTERTPQLNNPGYPGMLAKIYQGANMTINGARLLESGDVLVNTTITLKSGDVIQARFHVQKFRHDSEKNSNFLIVAEDEPGVANE